MTQDNISSNRLYLIYHFFYPDDVVSARHFGEFAEELALRGWEVTVFTSNRWCRYPKKKIVRQQEKWKGVDIQRFRRPSFDQSKPLSRLLNAAILMVQWGWRMRHFKNETLIIGTDPQFVQLLFPLIKFFSKSNQIVFWSYDLFPEAIIADQPDSLVAKLAERFKPVMAWAYKSMDLCVDIGSCMRRLLDRYSHQAARATLVPWALVEPQTIPEPDNNVRKKLFGKAKLGLLYSGNLGKSHEYKLFLQLARRVREKTDDIGFCFGCRGARAEELHSALLPSDTNIRLAGFCDESELETRLASADIHLLSLRQGSVGIVVPSKFFGSLAIGKPVLYHGPQDSSIAHWIKKYDVGMHLEEKNLDYIIERLLQMAHASDIIDRWSLNAFNAYHNNFSKKTVMDQWHIILKDIKEKQSKTINQN